MLKKNASLLKILDRAKEERASDIHFSSNNHISFRIDGDIQIIKDLEILSVKDIVSLMSPIMKMKKVHLSF